MALVAWLLVGCGGSPVTGVGEETGGREVTGRKATAPLERGIARVDSAVRAVDSIFKPLPLLTPPQEEALRAFGNAAQLAQARRRGIERGASGETLAALEREGRLVRLVDSEYWVMGDLDYSQQLVVPAVVGLLTEIGERFHERLAAIGAPDFRFEVSSALRSAADQEALRAVNPNAALGPSTHEHATTVDLLYSAFAAPAEPIAAVGVTGAEWATPFLERYAVVAAERLAARRALELKALLGAVLLEVQEEGRVMVTLERQQPVFHMTLAGAP